MCIFTGSVKNVSTTKIFVADVDDGQHGCVYSMKAGIKTPVAMVLPVPVKDQKQEAITFINLEKYPKFFKDLEDCWEQYLGDMMVGCAGGTRSRSLKVHDVGQYIASFVPSVAYFAKLHAKFRLSTKLISKFTGYQKFGYAVFQLKDSANESDFHPMAFRYTPAQQKQLFFPTVHVHDGETYHKEEHFDHVLYAQPETYADRNYWEKNYFVPEQSVKIELTHGLVHPTRPMFKTSLFGEKKNNDYILTPEYRLNPNPQTLSPVGK